MNGKQWSGWALAGLLVGSASALEFSQTIFFGDSLSDSGAFVGNPDAGAGGKFTTNPGPVWSERFARKFGHAAVANNPDNPNTDLLGTNYAQGGAQVTNPQGVGQTPSPQNALPIVGQIDFYFEQSNGRADGDALYSLWGGANDLFYNMGLVAGGLIGPDQAAANLMTSAADLVAQGNRLTSAGARYLIVPLLPDVGGVPAWVLETVQTAGSGHPQQQQALLAAATVLAVGGPDPAAVQAQALAAAEEVLGLPAGSLTPAFEQTQALASGLAGAFNAALQQQAAAAPGNLILLDTWRLFDEMMADPAAFGLLNVTGTACTTASSLYCTADTLVDSRAPQFFLYADGVHPTTAGHAIFADYAYSVVVAPALVANLPEVALGALRGQQQLLEARVAAGFGSGWSLFVAGGLGWQSLEAGQAWDADSDDAHLLAGLARRLDDRWVVGAALGYDNSQADFADDLGSFELDLWQLSLFADYRQGGLFGTLLATWAPSADFDAIERLVRLGGGTRLERGDTSADLWAIEGRLGYELWRNDRFTLGPYGGLNYQSVEVDGYREEGLTSTSMNFGSQSRDSLLLEAGLFADYRLGAARLHGALGYEAELDDDDRTLRAGLNSLAGSRFALYDIAPSDHYWKLDLSLEGEVADGVSLGIAYRLRAGEEGDRQQQASVGLNLVF